MKNFILIITLFTSLLSFSQVPSRAERDYDIKGSPDVVIYEDNAKKFTQVFSEGVKYGLKRNDSILLKPIYETIRPSGYGFVIRNHDLYGFATTNGKIILDTQYDSIGVGSKSYIVKKSGKYGAFDENGNPFVPIKYAKILYSNPISKIALIESKGQQPKLFLKDKIVDDQYDNIILYENVAILNKGAKKGLIIDGKIAFPIEYDNISNDGKVIANSDYIKKSLETKKYFDLRNKLDAIILQKDKKFGVVINNELEYPVVYDKVNYEIYRRTIIVEKDKLKGVYLIGTKKKLDVVYDDIYLDGTVFIEVKKDKLTGVFDYNLNVILPLEYDDAQVQGMNSGLKIIKNKKQGWAGIKGEIIIPAVYDKIDDFDGFGTNSFSNLFKVTNGELNGVIDSNNKIIIPIEFEYIFERNDYICGKTKEGKFGLYKPDGTVILKPEYNFIFESVAQGSKILFAQKNTLYTVVDKKGTIVFDRSIKKYGYINDEYNLLNPLLTNSKSYLFVQDDKNKFGLYDEIGEKQCLPFVYDEIRQKTIFDRKALFIVRKEKKFGVVDDQNTIVIPFIYDDLSFDLLNPYLEEGIVIPAKKNKKYGLISIANKEIIPFIYMDIQRISDSKNLFKAKSNNKYNLINSSGKILSANSFDDIANFEGNEALTFNNKTMKVINDNGKFSGITQEMTMHIGYKTFEDLKLALIAALNSPTNDLLLEFSTKIAPSKHILYYLKTNIFDKKTLAYSPSQEIIAKQYFRELEGFKKTRWNDERFAKKYSLQFTDDYTLEDNNIVTNKRVTDEAFGTTFLEHLLRNAIKVNGYWISSYFMKRYFQVSEY